MHTVCTCICVHKLCVLIMHTHTLTLTLHLTFHILHHAILSPWCFSLFHSVLAWSYFITRYVWVTLSNTLDWSGTAMSTKAAKLYTYLWHYAATLLMHCQHEQFGKCLEDFCNKDITDTTNIFGLVCLYMLYKNQISAQVQLQWIYF